MDIGIKFKNIFCRLIHDITLTLLKVLFNHFKLIGRSFAYA